MYFCVLCIICFVTFPVLFVCICVLYYCHQVTTQLQLNIYYVINQQPDATVFQFIILTFVYGSTGFGRFLAHHQELNDCSGSLWFYFRIVVDSRAVFVVGPAGSH